MPWVKGQSGNPNGRPKAYRDVVKYAQKRTKLAIRTLEEIATSGENESARVRAAEALLERGWGKAHQPLTGADGGPIEVAAKVIIELPDNGRGDR